MLPAALASRIRAVVLGFFLVGSGCGTLHVTPPTATADPVAVFVADYGDTARLLIPREDGGFAEYAFGEWRWYALDRFGVLNGAAALLIPTAGALANREHPPAPQGWPAERWIASRTDPEHLHRVTVERERAAALLAGLDAAFTEHLDTMVFNPARSLRMVKVGHYWILNQSSTELAGWLRELGCEVRGWTLVANLRVHPGGPGGAGPEGGGAVSSLVERRLRQEAP